jgi:hypothetical protein
VQISSIINNHSDLFAVALGFSDFYSKDFTKSRKTAENPRFQGFCREDEIILSFPVENLVSHFKLDSGNR